jgi:hypothetical protein
MKLVKLKRHMSTKHAEFKNKPIEFFLEEIEKPLQAEIVDRTTHSSTTKGTESII